MLRHVVMIAAILALTNRARGASEPLKVGVFAVDASPPIGSPLAYDPTRESKVTATKIDKVGQS